MFTGEQLVQAMQPGVVMLAAVVDGAVTEVADVELADVELNVDGLAGVVVVS
jgi:hypothetical protein